MKALFSGVGIVDGRGKLNGTVMSANRFGSFARTKKTPVNRNTSYQTAVRATFSSLSTGWGSLLTEAQRGAWRAFAKDHPFSNIFGQSRNLTGANMYVSLNAGLANAGMTLITVPPADVTTGQLGAIALTATVAAGGTLSVTTAETSVPGTAQILVYATKLESNGKTFVKSALAYIGVFASGASPYNIKAAWIAKYGAFPTVAGHKIFVALRIITLEGWQSIPSGTSAFVS